MKSYVSILLLLVSFPATASDYIYLRTGDVDVGFSSMLGFVLNVEKVDKVCDGDKCYGIAQQFDDVDEYNSQNKRCFIRYGDMVGSSLLKPDYYMGSKKITGDPKYITFACKRVDVGSDQAKAAEAQYNRCMQANGVDVSNAAKAMKIAGEMDGLHRQGLSMEEIVPRLVERYNMADVEYTFSWYQSHQTCFPQAYPNKGQAAQ